MAQKQTLRQELTQKPTIRLECASHCCCCDCYTLRADAPPCATGANGVGGYKISKITFRPAEAKSTLEDHLYY